MVIAVDFDGTCVTHEFPGIGKDIGAIPVLKALVEKGHQIILYTMRCGDLLQDAIDWFNKNDIPLLGANENPTQKQWTMSPKVFAHLYIDDVALGCPLMKTSLSKRPYVDWKRVRYLLTIKGIL